MAIGHYGTRLYDKVAVFSCFLGDDFAYVRSDISGHLYLLLC
jgi:hypothetical protein